MVEKGRNPKGSHFRERESQRQNSNGREEEDMAEKERNKKRCHLRDRERERW